MRKPVAKPSDTQIRKATAPRALPVYSEDELETREWLVERGAQGELARRKGGRAKRPSSDLCRIRRTILIPDIYEHLGPSLKKTPTGVKTIARVQDRLKEVFGVHVARETVKRDITAITTGKLRKL